MWAYYTIFVVFCQFKTILRKSFFIYFDGFSFIIFFDILNMVIIVERKNLLKNIGHAVLIFLLFNYSWLFQLIPIIGLNLDVEKLSDKSEVLLTCFASLMCGMVLFFIYKNDIIEEFKKFKNKFLDNFDVGVKYWFFGLLTMIGCNLLITKVFSGGGAANEDAVQGMISALPFVMLINAGFLAPWCEELVFRKSIKKIFNNKWLYVLVSGVLFGLAHVLGQTSTWTDWLYMLSYGGLGAAFAASYYDTDTVFTPILFHTLHNVVLIIISII